MRWLKMVKTMPEDKLRSLYIDMPVWNKFGINVDDFLVAIGKTKSNSVYHVFSSNPKPKKDKRIRNTFQDSL